MTRKIKKLLLYDSGKLRVFLKPSIKATRVGISSIDISYDYKYNLLGFFTLNIIQLIFDLVWYGLSQFSIQDYFNRKEHRVLCNIERNFFNEKEINYLSKFPEYEAFVLPDETKFNI